MAVRCEPDSGGLSGACLYHAGDGWVFEGLWFSSDMQGQEFPTICLHYK